MYKKLVLGFLAVVLVALGVIMCVDPWRTELLGLFDDTSSKKTTEDVPINDSELFENFYGRAEDLLKEMTLEEKVGQMFLVRFEENDVIQEIQEENPGGYILFAKDFRNETPSSLTAKLKTYQDASKIGLIFGVDEEGGTVVRVSLFPAFRSAPFLSPQELREFGGLEAILADSTEKTTLLKSLGINMNLAPVADVSTNTNDFIHARSYGRDAEETAEYVAAVVRRMKQDGMISVMKHFPGYGNNVDTHTGVAIDQRAYETFEKVDFLPFVAGIEVGGPCILVSHNIVEAMDVEYPASLSARVHEILREELHFSGIIMTDDLAMDAVKGYAANGRAAVQAVLAGNDVIITSDFQTQKREVMDAVRRGEITEDIINQAVKRILAWKYEYRVNKNIPI